MCLRVAAEGIAEVINKADDGWILQVLEGGRLTMTEHRDGAQGQANIRDEGRWVS